MSHRMRWIAAILAGLLGGAAEAQVVFLGSSRAVGSTQALPDGGIAINSASIGGVPYMFSVGTVSIGDGLTQYFAMRNPSTA